MGGNSGNPFEKSGENVWTGSNGNQLDRQNTEMMNAATSKGGMTGGSSNPSNPGFGVAPTTNPQPGTMPVGGAAPATSVGGAQPGAPAGAAGAGGPNIFQQSADQYNQAGGTYSNVAGGNAGFDSMNKWINPYQQQVIDQTVGRMDDQTQLDLDRVGDAATASGAFGGSRHGLVEGQLMDDSQRNIGEMVNKMSQQGFNTAAGLGQQDVQNMMQGAGGLAGLSGQGFNMGRSITGDQSQQGSIQQQLAQRLLTGAGGQYQDFVDNPQKMLNLQLAALGGNPLMGESTSYSTPGMLDYLSAGLQFGGEFVGSGKGG